MKKNPLSRPNSAAPLASFSGTTVAVPRLAGVDGCRTGCIWTRPLRVGHGDPGLNISWANRPLCRGDNGSAPGYSVWVAAAIYGRTVYPFPEYPMDPLHLGIETLSLLFATGLLAGLIDTLAGGGGLIALPALLFAGLPPQLALGTNKLQGSFGTLAASYHFYRQGQISLRQALPTVACTLIGATSGALLVQRLDAGLLKPLIPGLLLLIFLYTLLTPRLGRQDRPARLSTIPFSLTFGLSLGFYDGFFGPGTGSLWTVALMSLAGHNMTRATGYTKIMNCTSNITALAWFLVGGNVLVSVGLVMAGGQLIGARIGAALAIAKGVRVIRPIFLSMILITIVRLLVSPP
jgi:uncharacterized protein